MAFDTRVAELDGNFSDESQQDKIGMDMELSITKKINEIVVIVFH
jgi:hypothetical protein